MPALQRFYGGNPDAWLEMPLNLLRIFSNEMQELRARESLNMLTIMSLAFGGVEKNMADSIIGNWHKLAGNDKPKPRPRRHPDELAMDLASMGIRVKYDG